MQAELQTALFQAFDTLNLQRVKTFSVPPVTLCGLGALGACGQEAQARVRRLTQSDPVRFKWNLT